MHESLSVRGSERKKDFDGKNGFLMNYFFLLTGSFSACIISIVVSTAA